MFNRFFPDETASSAYDIGYEELYGRGVRGLIFDIDNTLVPHGAPADDRAKVLFKKLRTIGFRCYLISNNKEGRVRPFAKAVGAGFICNAHKPSAGGYMAAMKAMGTDKSSTVFIGDQLFTDVYGAKRAGISNILVGQLHPKEEIQIVFKRKLEKIVLYFYKKDVGRQKNS